MEQTWRWFGPKDPVSLAHVRQAGATGIVSALHDNYRGEVWSEDAIAERKAVIEAAGLRWSVVESIPVPNAIKLGDAGAPAAIAAFCDSLRRVGRAGIRTVCYNFMPVVDWTRTELRHPMPSGGLALRFDMTEFVGYDVFVLRRPDAAASYPEAIVRKAEALIAGLPESAIARLERTIIAGLPGAEAEHSRDGIRDLIARYTALTPDDLRANLTAFQKVIAPVAEEVGVRLGIHPDDPPFPLFGLPRVVSTPDDLRRLFAAVPDAANGLTFCTGSFGARDDNDLSAMLAEFAPRVHFVHLRNVTTDPDGSFVEDDHLRGNADMVDILRLLRAEEKRRGDDHDIPFRPDHGHLLLDDQDKTTQPGYSAIGRLKGLAELRGILTALDHPLFAKV